MNLFSFIQKAKPLERGGGLVEYSPLILFSACGLVSLYQVIVVHDAHYLWVIGGIVLFVLSLIAFSVYRDRTQKRP